MEGGVGRGGERFAGLCRCGGVGVVGWGGRRARVVILAGTGSQY